MSKKKAKSKGSKALARIEFEYEKAPLYRTIHVDGCWGGSASKAPTFI